MDNYYYKYLKYKQKYLDLKGGKIEGVQLERLNEIIAKYKKDFTPIVYCDKRGFKQHQGECWNDTIQTLLCFSDGIKHMFQRKLWNLTADEIIEFSRIRERYNYLPYFYKNDPVRLANMERKLKTYIELLQNRLCSYIDPELYDTPKLCKVPDSCSLKNPESELLLEPSKKTSFDDPESPKEGMSVRPRLVRQDTRRIGVEAALTGLEISSGKDIERKPIDEDHDHGGSAQEYVILFNLLSVIFLDNPYMLKTDIIRSHNLKDDHITDDIICVEISSFDNSGSGHSTGFLNCNKESFYYDDNRGIVKCNWINYLKACANNKNLTPILNLDEKTEPFFKDDDDNYYCMNSDGTVTKTDLDAGSLDQIYEIFVIKEVRLIKKIKIENNNDYINKFAENLINIEIYKENYRNIKRYIDNGLNIKSKYTYSENILHVVLDNGCNEIRLIQYLIDNGIDVTQKNIIGETPLHLVKAKNLDIIKLLITNGADILAETESKDTVLSYLVLLNNVEITKYLCEELIKKGINIKKYVETLDLDDITIMHKLARYNMLESFKYLFETYEVNVNIRGYNNYTPLLTAIYYNSSKIFNYNSSKIFNYLLDNNKYPGYYQVKLLNGDNMLHMCAKANNITAIEKIYNTLISNPILHTVNLLLENNSGKKPNEIAKKYLSEYILYKDTQYNIEKRRTRSITAKQLSDKQRLNEEITNLDKKMREHYRLYDFYLKYDKKRRRN